MMEQKISQNIVIAAFRNSLGDTISKGGNLSFNCPNCEDNLGNDRNKYNLEVNCDKYVFHCWSCNDSGTLYSLAKKHADNEYIKYFPKININDKQQLHSQIKNVNEVKLPFPNFKKLNEEQIFYLINYRGLNNDIIKKFDIRSFNNQLLFINKDSITGLINYWLIHDYSNTKNYIKPKDIQLNSICMFEHLINPELPIILVEGIYDALVLPNAIPLLGLGLNRTVRSFLQGKKNVLVFVDSSVKLQQKQKFLLQPLKQIVQNVYDIGEEIKQKFPNYGDSSKIFTPLLNSNIDLYEFTKKTISKFYL